jgi:hypothetical protein
MPGLMLELGQQRYFLNLPGGIANEMFQRTPVQNRISRWAFGTAAYNQKRISLNRSWLRLVAKYTISYFLVELLKALQLHPIRLKYSKREGIKFTITKVRFNGPTPLDLINLSSIR